MWRAASRVRTSVSLLALVDLSLLVLIHAHMIEEKRKKRDLQFKFGQSTVVKQRKKPGKATPLHRAGAMEHTRNDTRKHEARSAIRVQQGTLRYGLAFQIEGIGK